MCLQAFEQDRGDVAFGEGRDDHDDALAGPFGAFGDFQRRRQGRAGGDAAGDALGPSETAGGGEGFLVGDLDDLVDRLDVQDVGDEDGADAPAASTQSNSGDTSQSGQKITD